MDHNHHHPTQAHAHHPTQPQPHPAPSAPQIRSRITVVCAECKRLKLKCDRRNPCGSCTKRDTVARCIYSPAAAEKVDLHSLNNRLIQVESTLALISSGQPIPAFQSSYPFTFSSAPQSASTAPSTSAGNPLHVHHHQHHHHHAVDTFANDSIAVSLHDITAIWLEDLDVGSAAAPSSPLLHDSSSSRRPSTAGFIKLEPSPIELAARSSNTSRGNNSIVIEPSTPYMRPRNQSISNRHQQQQAHMLLPPLTIYYPVPSIPPPGSSASSSSAFPSHPTSKYPPSAASSSPASSSSTPYTFPSTQPIPSPLDPQTTSALLSLLPSTHTCIRLLEYASEIISVRPVPLGPNGGWKAFERRCIRLISTLGADKEKREREKEARRAHASYYPSSSGPASNGEVDLEEEGEEDAGLTLFAALAAALAVGTLGSPSYWTSSVTGKQPAQGRDSPAFLYALSQQALSVWDIHRSSTQSNESAPEEQENLDYLVAYLLGIQYLMLLPQEDGGGPSEVFPLVGKMVNVARGMGLSKSTSMPSASAKRRKNGDKKLGGKNAREKEKEQQKQLLEMRRMLWWDVVFYDLFISDTLGHASLVPSSSFSTPLPECAGVQADDDDESDQDGDGADDRVEDTKRVEESDQDRYFGVRCRLTQVAQAIKQRVAQPECCCGYTLDQAATLEGEVRRFLGGLPSVLRFSPSANSPSSAASRSSSASADDIYPYPSVDDIYNENERETLQAQSAELALVANLLLIKIYMPFLRPSTSMQPGQVPANGSWHTASQACIGAAQVVIRAAKVSQGLRRPLPHTSCVVQPAMLDFYSLDEALFCATAICAHAELSGRVMLSMDNNIQDDLVTGLDSLGEFPDTEEGNMRRKFLDAIRKRIASNGINVLKRKHSQLELSTNSSREVVTLDYPVRTNSSVNQGDRPSPAHPHPPHPPPFSTHKRRPSASSRKPGEKEKKQTKKNHPTVGIRVRAGPETLTSRVRTQSGSTTTSSGTSAPGTMQAPGPRPLLTTAPRMSVGNDEMGYSKQVQPPQHSRNPTPAPAPPMAGLHDNSAEAFRSRSSSLSQHAEQAKSNRSLDYAMSYGGPAESHRRYSTHDVGPQQHQQPSPQQLSPSQSQSLSPQQHSFVNSYDASQHQTSYDAPQSYEQGSRGNPGMDPPAYGPVSSPYQNTGGPSDNSPYTSNGSGGGVGQPSTPTFGPSSGVTSHNPSPPAFASSSPAGYYQIINGTYDVPYDPPSGPMMNHGQPMSLSGMVMEPSPMEQAPGNTTMYEKSHQPMYDVKPPPMDSLSHHQHQLIQPPPSYGEQEHLHGMTGTGHPQPQQSWPPTHQQHQSPSMNVQSEPQPYWGAPEYRNY